MSDRLAFLRTIRDHPGDDTARLVFADWLDEHGEHTEAEFIRVQLELDPVRDNLEDCRVRELIQREERLRQDVPRAFHGADLDYRGGLPVWACVSLDTLLSHGEDLFATHPTIRELSVFDIAGRGDALAACELLTNLDVLELADELTTFDHTRLATSTVLRSVPKFILWGGWNDALGDLLASVGRPDWPRRIDVLWLFDGLVAGISASECDQPITSDVSWAAQINEIAGRELAFDVRPAKSLFPLRGWAFDEVIVESDVELGLDSGRGLYYGQLPDGTQAVAAAGTENWHLVTFDDRGLVTRSDTRPCPVLGAEWGQLEIAAREWVTQTLGMTPAIVRVREFEVPDLSSPWPALRVRLWPNGITGDLSTWTRPERLPERTWRERGGTIARWLRHRHFVIDWGNDFWADWRGTIHTS